MNKLILILVLSVVAAATSENILSSILPKTWLTTCKPCLSSLIECSVCVRDGCGFCFAGIDNSECQRCGSDIKTTDFNLFYCDPSFEYHEYACKIKCRWQNRVPFYQTGRCNLNNGKCECF